MNNLSQTKKKIYAVYIISKNKKICEPIKNVLKNTIDESKITCICDPGTLPSSLESDTYLIFENNKTLLSGISNITPKRNIKTFIYIEDTGALDENDLTFFIKRNIDHVIYPGNLDALKYEKFMDARIFKKKHYNAFIERPSTLLEDLCHNNDGMLADLGINIYGISNHLNSVIEKASKIAQAESSVLITGESGTGKELIARLIHNKSRRNANPMVSVNCGAFPEGLLESELFGYKKGAFTGAFTDKQGRFDLADKSSLFLDEIGDMSLSLQVKLLRVIQEREIEPIGSLKTKKIDVRIISATNKNLEEMISKKLFREDFYYRINVIPVHLLPLRDRKADVVVLIYYFLKKFGDSQNETVYGIAEEAFKVLLDYDWYGNVRELENLMEMMVVLNETGLITLKDIPEKYLKTPASKSSPEEIQITPSPVSEHRLKYSGEKKINLKKEMERIELEMITNAMEKSQGVKEKAAKMLGMNRTTLIEKLKRYEKNKANK